MSKLSVITLPPLVLAGIAFAMAEGGLFGGDKAAPVVLRVPQRFARIQSAIDAAKSGDTVLVAAGVYRERLKMKPGVTVKSEGDDAKGKVGLKRAEDTVLASADGEGAGVEMAERATLDGFSVTGVGKYDESLWQHHYDTHGNEQEHEQIGQPGIAGIAVGCNGTVLNNIVHHNGYTGIAITGAAGKKVSPHIAKNVCYRNMGGGIGSMNGSTALIENNLCFENFYAGIGHSGASPVVRGNTCHGNVRAGIGISEGASPTVTDNRCFKNRRAGIGIRTGKETRPVVEKNECFENDMAGIGIEDDAMPVVRENRCHDNLLAGIGVQDGASPQLVGNVCTANKQSGIGLTGKAQATITNNRIKDNALVAIGVTGGSQASIEDNELSRDGGMPPMIAVLDGSQATISGNTIRGGGVAGVLVKGSAEIRRNHFLGAGPRRNGPPNFAVWVQKGASVIFIGNDVTGWRQALSSSGAAKIVAKDNKTSSFLGTAFVVKDSKAPVEITGNTAISDDPDAKAVEVTGAAGDISHNELKRASPKP